MFAPGWAALAIHARSALAVVVLARLAVGAARPTRAWHEDLAFCTVCNNTDGRSGLNQPRRRVLRAAIARSTKRATRCSSPDSTAAIGSKSLPSWWAMRSVGEASSKRSSFASSPARSAPRIKLTRRSLSAPRWCAILHGQFPVSLETQMRIELRTRRPFSRRQRR